MSHSQDGRPRHYVMPAVRQRLRRWGRRLESIAGFLIGFLVSVVLFAGLGRLIKHVSGPVPGYPDSYLEILISVVVGVICQRCLDRRKIRLSREEEIELIAEKVMLIQYRITTVLAIIFLFFIAIVVVVGIYAGMD